MALNPMLKRLVSESVCVSGSDEYDYEDNPSFLLGRAMGCQSDIDRLKAEVRLAKAEADVARLELSVLLSQQALEEINLKLELAV